MGIQTITSENLASYVAERQAAGSTLATGEQIVEAVTRIAEAKATKPAEPVIATGEEKTADAPPEPSGKEPTAKANAAKAKAGTDPAIQKRIDEVVRKQKEAEEFAEDEYNQRLRAERRIGELETQLAAAKPPAPKEEELKRPSPKDFTDQGAYDTAMEAYEAKRDERVATKAAQQARMAAEQERRDADLRTKAQAAAETIPDFWDVIQSRQRKELDVPVHIKAAIEESEMPAHLAYHLAKNPEEEKRIYSLPVAKALLELGKIETQYTKQPEAEPKPNGEAKPTIETTRAPAPIASLKADSGIVDPTTPPADYNAYKEWRYNQMRAKRRH